MTDLVSGPRGRHFLYRLAELVSENWELAQAMTSLEMRLRQSVDGPPGIQFQPLGFASRLRYKIDDEEGTFAPRFPRLELLSLNASAWKRGKLPSRKEAAWSASVARGGSYGTHTNLVTPAGIAARIDKLPGSGNPEQLVQALEESVASAMYWQEPDMIDRILDNPTIIASLAAFAIRSDITPNTLEKLSDGEEMSVRWILDPPIPQSDRMVDGAEAILERWARLKVQDVLLAKRERPDDPTANWSGAWYSVPPGDLVSSNRQVPGGLPACLRYVEDGPVGELAEIRTVTAHAHVRVYVIDSVSDWVRLCNKYPMDVTAEVRHDWYRVTGRDSTWIIPNWRDVARDWEAVRLTVHGYLTSATKAIQVRDGESMIAGWNPGETYWLTDVHETAPEPWIFVDYDHWEKQEP